MPAEATPSGVVVRHAEDPTHRIPIVDGEGGAEAVLWPGVGSRERAFHRIRLQHEARTAPQRHARSEAVYYVVDGQGVVIDEERDAAHDLHAHQVVFLGRDTPYRIRAQPDLTLARGPCPPDPRSYGSAALEGADEEVGAAGPENVVMVLDPEDGIPVPMISQDARIVVSPHVGARYATLNVVSLAAGESNVPHQHRESEDSIYILAGNGSIVDVDNEVTHPLRAGSVVLVPPGIWHAVRGEEPDGLRSVGAPVPPNWDMLRQVGISEPPA